MAGYYHKDKDYSEAIANESDAGKREQLLAERQNKINDMGLSGKVASNGAVSGWTGDYRPYYAPSGGGGSSKSGGSSGGGSSGGGASGSAGDSGFSVAALYREIERRRLEAFEAARRENSYQLTAQKGQIEGQYTDSVTRAQVNARLTASGNEEKLAALGLNSGGKYDAPTSGYTETSRVAADNALRQDLNSLSATKQMALAQAESAAGAADSALLTSNAQAAADAALKLASIAAQQQNADRTYALSSANADRSYALNSANADRSFALNSAAVTGYLNGTPTLDFRQYQASLAQDSRDFESAASQAAYKSAMERWKTYGYVLPADVAVLGVPAGTGTADERYSAASLRLNQLKTAYQTSK